MADGTTQQCGRVGSCHIYFKEAVSLLNEAVFYKFYFGEAIWQY
jgi:hypothetical protein